MPALRNIFKGNVEIKELYVNRIIDYFAISLIGIFIPIYLLQTGFSLSQVFGYFTFVWGTTLIMSFFAAHVASVVGIKRTIVLRVPILILFLFLLTNLEYIHPGFLYLTAIIGGTATAFYWIPLNSEFCRNVDRKKVGSETGYLTALPRFFVMFAPLLGGIMLEYFGFHSVFILVMLLAALSVIPLSFTGECLVNFRFNTKKEKSLNRSQGFSGKFFIQGMVWITETIVWPIYVFIVLGSVVSVGVAGTLSVLGLSLFTIIIGKFSDRASKKNLIMAGSLLFAAVWFFRILSSTPLEIFLLSLMGGLSMALIDVPIFAMFSKISKRNPLAMIVSREVFLTLGKITLLMSLLLLALFLSSANVFSFAFAFAGIMVLGLLFI